MQQPHKDDVQRFLSTTVLPAMNEVAAEMQKRGLQAHVQDSLESDADSESTPGRAGRAAARLCLRRARRAPHHAPRSPCARAPAATRAAICHEPVTFFEDGRSGYDVQYLRSEELIADILRQYERYLSLSQTSERNS
ncbi:hypothetical protein [Comamonas sp. JC664]|uniref:hypothetical protein n=1 Tax=Comamonas sp. JC664 TaxID=2801917 RepID=UPI0036220264